MLNPVLHEDCIGIYVIARGSAEVSVSKESELKCLAVEWHTVSHSLLKLH